MRILRLILNDEIVDLGIEGKILFLKWGEMNTPYRLGELKHIKEMSSKDVIFHQGQSIKTPSIIKQMGKSITSHGLKLAEKYNDDEFYNDFVKDFKEMDEEGTIKFVGEFNEWSS